jgi:quinoprotein glucose dehydrogenase
MTNTRNLRLSGLIALTIVGGCSPGNQKDDSTWPTFAHDASNSKFSALTQIDTTNVSQLKEAWRFEDVAEGGGLYFNPVMMNNRVIGLMPSNKLVALDAGTGKMLWEFTPDSSAIPNWSRGITYHPGSPDRILLVSGGTLYAINAEDGHVIPDF